VAGVVIVLAIGYMMFAAMQGGSEYYVTASELNAMGEKALGQQLKIGGRVVDGSVQWDKGSNTVAFSLADEKQSLPVSFKGTVPDTFQPGTDVILQGQMGADGTFQANNMMAKCASKYEPANK
jgi:cytochrome c-type biogenesis protein CcmE